MKSFFLPLLFVLACVAAAGPTSPVWTKQDSNVSARLRGISAVSDNVAWASGSANTVLRTADGGANWKKIPLPEQMTAAPLDFRDIDAIDEQTAYLLSIGESTASRIFKTTDSGAHWMLQYTNPDPKGFLDAMAFWDADNGLVIGDSIDGHLQLLITSDGGSSWTKVPDAALPPALPGEGAFSASGSNIAMIGVNDAWIAMNARVLHTSDRGKTWSVSTTPIDSSESAGIFSITFRDSSHGVVVGGDYKNENAAINNVAITADGGKTWKLIREKGLTGYRSAVKYLPGGGKSMIAVGPTGADFSNDDGQTWTALSYAPLNTGFDAISFVRGHTTAWVSGNQGALAQLKFD